MTAIRERALPHGLLYLQRLHRMEQTARAAIRRLEGHVTVIVPDEYVDLLALYLGPTLAWLNAREPGWGGRANAAGSPLTSGSRLPIEEVVALLNECA